MIIGGYDTNEIDKRGTKRIGAEDEMNMSKTADGIFWMNINTNYYW